jgi:predicted PurR-regulated permease PerM
MRLLASNSVPQQTTRWVIIAVIVIILLLAVWEVHTTLLLVFASIILVVLFTMPIRFLVRRGMNRGPATLMSLGGIVGVVIVLTMLALPSLLEQFTTLAVDVQEGISEVANQWDAVQNDSTGQLRAQYPLIANLQLILQNTFQVKSLNDLINELTRQLGNAVGQLSGSVLPVVSGVASTLLSIIIVIFLSLYFLAEPRMHEEGVIRLFPLGYRDRVRQIIDRIDFMLRSWLQGQLLLMLIVGVLSWFFLALLGIRQAAALGVLAGLFSFVPNFGPIAALVPSLAVGFAQAPQSIGWIVVVIYGTSFLQSQIIAPLLFSESMNLPPVLVLLGQIFAAVFFGFLGLMLAVPLTAILVILVQEVYIKDFLGDKQAAAQVALDIDDGLLPDEA